MTNLRSLLLALSFLAAVAPAFAQAPAGTLPAVTTAPANATLHSPGDQATVDLTGVFGLPSVTGTVVQFATPEGPVNVELFNNQAPITTANFLSYVNSGAYTDVFINRSVPGFVLQGGGFWLNGSTVSDIATNASIQLEYGIANTLGTIAMARSTDANSATNQWFFNLVDNTTTLGASNDGGYAVFGRVLGTGMTPINSVAALPVADLSSILNNSGNFVDVPIIDYTGSLPVNPAMVQVSNLVIFPSIAVIPIYPTSATSTAVLSFSASSSNPNVATTVVTASSLQVTAGEPGTATITATATDSNGNAAATQFTVTVTGTAPVFYLQPVPQTIASGSTVVFDATASGLPAPTYQWYLGNTALSGQNNARLVIAGATAANAGTYYVEALNANGTATSNTVTLAVNPNLNPAHLVNLSIISDITSQLTMGFITLPVVQPPVSESFLIRACGPVLTAFGYTSDYLPDPTLTVYQQNPSKEVASNTGWGSSAGNVTAVEAADTATFAFPLTDTTSGDSALVASLPSIGGGYSVVVSGKSGDSGEALTEVYDNTPAAGYVQGVSPRLTNLSCAANLPAGSATNSNPSLTVGFVLGASNSGARTVLVRVSGPTLQNLGYPTTFMPDPVLTVVPLGASAAIASDAGWGGDPGITQVVNALGTFQFSSTSSLDSAVLLTLSPTQGYTVNVSSASNAGGEILVEVYEVP